MNNISSKNLKKILWIAGISFLMTFSKAVVATNVALMNLEPLEWQNRIIVIDPQASQVPQVEKTTIQEWVGLLKENRAQVVERHIYWFVLSNPVETNYSGAILSSFAENLRTRYRFDAHPVLLIGKDGEIKERAQDLDLKYFYHQIDQMPMRRMEMRQQMNEIMQ